MKPKRSPRASVNAEALFGALVDVGALRFPKMEAPSDSDITRLSARVGDALKSSLGGKSGTIAELIRARRAALKLRASQLGERVGISLRTLGGLESGQIAPVEVQPETFGKLLLSLDIAFEEYVVLHGRSVKPKARSAYRRAALKDRREGSGVPFSLAPASRGWLARLAEVMKL